ncbi:transglycosylase family protein [Actinomycetospora sp. C-140]
MLRNTDESLARALGRRAAQVALVGAVAATPMAFTTGLASADTTDWDQLAQCESGGDWSTQTGNGFGGGLQFTDSTWRAFGGSGQPEDASRSEQIQVAERVKAEQGMNAWPTCSKKTGQSDSSSSSSSDDD